MEHAQQVRIRGLASSEVDHHLRVSETKREIHTTQDAPYCSLLRAANENSRVGQVRALLANLDHTGEMPPPSRIETLEKGSISGATVP